MTAVPGGVSRVGLQWQAMPSAPQWQQKGLSPHGVVGWWTHTHRRPAHVGKIICKADSSVRQRRPSDGYPIGERSERLGGLLHNVGLDLSIFLVIENGLKVVLAAIPGGAFTAEPTTL
jgi:hypothetical protein